MVSLSKILGHSRLNIIQRYVNLLVSDLAKQVEEVDLLGRFAVGRQIRLRTSLGREKGILGRLGGVRKTVNPPYGYDHTEDYFCFSSNLLAANGLSKPFANGKSTGDSRISGARGCSHLDGTK